MMHFYEKACYNANVSQYMSHNGVIYLAYLYIADLDV